MTDTRALLNRIAQFRQRLESLPRLMPGDGSPRCAAPTTPPPPTEKAVASSRTQAILQESVRLLNEGGQQTAPSLIGRARRLLADAQGLVTRLRATADEPLLAGAPGRGNVADPLAVHYRETAALTEAAVRYALTFPESPEEQGRLCEGLEGMLDAAHRRFDLLAGTLEQRRSEIDRTDTLARFLCSLQVGEGPVDAAPIVGLAETILTEEPGRPLRFLATDARSTQGYLGGPEFPAPARWVAAHSLNVAYVAARIVLRDPEWQVRARDVVLAALLHDVGMVGIDAALLAQTGALDVEHRRAVEAHAKAGADLIYRRLPGLSHLAEAAAQHHERADATGYPGGLTNGEVSPLTRLVAVIDVYAAMCGPRPHRPQADPRAALTDVLLLAERGQLDRRAAEQLMSLGLYPAGTVVELASGWTAVVVVGSDARENHASAGRPLVALLADPDTRALANPRFVDLNASGGAVVRTLKPAERLHRLGRSYPEWA